MSDLYLNQCAPHTHSPDCHSLTKAWPGQTDISRIVYLKRAQLFHISRVYMQSLFRGRSELDDKLIMELVELSISQYSRTRRWVWILFSRCESTEHMFVDHRQAQSTLFNVTVVGQSPQVLEHR